MKGRRRSLFIACLGTFGGLLLWGWDDFLVGIDLQNGMIHRVLAIIEFLILGPGMGVMAFVASEYVRVTQAALSYERERTRQVRLVALGRVAGGLAHEVRNPLHNIRLLIEEAREADAPERVRLLERVDANLTRIDRAVELVYRLARPRSPALAGDGIADFAVLISEAVAEERRRSPQIEVRWTATGPILVVGAADDVRIALDNLFRNATAAAAKNGGAVEVVLRREGVLYAAVITNRGFLPAGYVDEGAGGFSAKADGLGLGLSISRQLLAEAGGSLVLAQVGETVEARLSLPASEGG